MERLEIYVEYNDNGTIERGCLDTNGLDSIVEITYNNADIRDIASRNINYSKSIVLPDTKNNMKLFKFISDLNFESNGTLREPSFNPNRKTKCIVLADSVEQFRGYLQLRKVTINKDNTTTYEVVLYQTLADFNSNIADRMLSDLPFDDIKQRWDFDNITTSWNSLTASVYYPFKDVGENWNADSINKYLELKHFKPHLSVSYLVNKIFAGSSFSWSGNFFDSNRFKYLNINLSPNMIYGTTFSDGKIFQVSKHTNIISLEVNQSNAAIMFPNPLPDFHPFIRYYAGSGTIYPHPTPNGTVQHPQEYPKILEFDDDSLNYHSNYNTNGLWDVITYEYENVTVDPKIERFILNLDAVSRAPLSSKDIGAAGYRSSAGLFNPNTQTEHNSLIEINVYRQFDPFTGNIHPDWPNTGYRIPFSGGQDTCIIYGAEGFSYTSNVSDVNVNTFSLPNGNDNLVIGGGGTVEMQYISIEVATDWLDQRRDVRYTPLYLNEKVKVAVRFGTHFLSINSTASVSNWNNNYLKVLTGRLPISLITSDPADLGLAGQTEFTPNTKFRNEVKNDVLIGGMIDFKYIIPEMKQSDFIYSIMRMFNLQFVPNPENEYDLTVEPYTDYYTNGEVKDWSGKLIDEGIDIQVLAETQDKTTILSYQEDEDRYNKHYKNEFGEVFGQYTYEISENQFLTGKKEIKISFANTPMVKLPPFEDNYSVNFIYPKIVNDENGVLSKFKPRIFTRNNGVVHLTNGLTLNVYSPLQKFVTQFTYYPYCGHIEGEPNFGLFDISFGMPREIYHTVNKYPYNNLTTTYYKDMLDNISGMNSRIVTAKFYLEPQDIHNFKYNDVIYLEIAGLGKGGGGQYYRVNKIANYNPAVTSLTTVELIKLDNFKAKKIAGLGGSKNGNSNLLMAGGISYVINGTASGTASGTYSATLSSNILQPAFIKIPQSGSIITNTSNTAFANSAAIGYNNYVGAGAVVSGNNNNVTGNSNNSFVSGDYNNINSASSSTIFGNYNTIKAGNTNVFVIGSGIEVDSSNVIMTDSPVIEHFNLIDCGEDEVLPLFGAVSNINLIDCGENCIVELGTDSPINLIDCGENKV